MRAKYFDWCSARVAERFVALGVAEIYELAGLLKVSGFRSRRW
jgi:hypothetical protein